MLKIIPSYTDGTSGAIAPLVDALNIKIHREINDLTSLEFDLPNDNNKLEIMNNSDDFWIVDDEGECYFLVEVSSSTSNHLTHITCRHVINLLDVDNIILDFPIMTSVNAKTILHKGLELIENDFFSLYEDDELNGDEVWVDQLTDVLDGYEKITVWKLIKEVMELIGHGELKYSNGRFAVVKRLGKDTDIYWSPGKNVERLTKAFNLMEVYNKVLVLGASDMPLNTEEYPNSIIISEDSVKKYGPRYTVKEFPDITDKDELKSEAEFLFSEDNPDRLDVPKISLDVKSYELNSKNPPKLGDGVRIISKELKIDEYRRIVSVDFYPLQPLKSTYTIGEKSDTIEKVISKSDNFASLLNSLTSNRKITPQGIKNLSKTYNTKNMINNSTFANGDNYWRGSGFSLDDPGALSGEGCATLPAGAYLEQEVDLSNINTNGIILTFGHKGGELTVELLSNGTSINHTTKLNTNPQTSTIFPRTDVYKSYNSVYSYKNDTNGKVTVRLSNNGSEDVLIDNVMLSENHGTTPLYTDGYDSKRQSGGGGNEYVTHQNIYYDMLTQLTTVGNTGYTFKINIPQIETPMTGMAIISLQLSGLSTNSNISTGLVVDEVVAGSPMKEFISPGGIDVFNFTIPIELSVVDGGNSIDLNISEISGGSFNLLAGSNISVILSPKTNTRTLLTTFNVGNTLPQNVVASVYRLSDGEVELELKGNTLDDVSQSLWNSAKRGEKQTFYNMTTIFTIAGNVNSIPNGMFSGHPNLKKVNGLGTLMGQTELNNVFFGCEKLETIEGGMPKGLNSALSTFENCINLKKVPAISTSSEFNSWQRTFSNCKSLTNYPYLIDTTAGLYETFDGCENLVTGPTSIQTSDSYGVYQNTFRNCYKLSGDMSLIWNGGDTSFYPWFEDMFTGVTSSLNIICDNNIEEFIRSSWSGTEVRINGNPL